MVTIVNKLGLHARPAMSFVDVASACASEISVRRAPDGTDVLDGKSIMQMMMLAATQGTQIEVTAVGPDCDEACKKLKELVDGGFDEE